MSTYCGSFYTPDLSGDGSRSLHVGSHPFNSSGDASCFLAYVAVLDLFNTGSKDRESGESRKKGKGKRKGNEGGEQSQGRISELRKEEEGRQAVAGLSANRNYQAPRPPVGGNFH